MKKLLLIVVSILLTFNVYSQTANDLVLSGLALDSIGDHIGAISLYEKAIELNPDYEPAYYWRGNARYILKDFQGSVSDMDKLISYHPERGELYYNRGNSKDLLGDTEGALADYKKCVELIPDYAEARFSLGNLKYGLDKYREAIPDFDRAIAADSLMEKAYYMRGVAKHAIGERKEAINDFSKVIGLDPSFADAFNMRGICKYFLEDFKGAIEDCTTAIKINPEDADYYLRRGIAEFALGNYAGATKSIGINGHFFTYNQRSEARYEAGDYEEAVSDYSEVLKTYNMDFSLWVARANARLKSGDRNGACEDLSKALNLGGGKNVEKLIRKNCRNIENAAAVIPTDQQDDFHLLIKEVFFVKDDSAYLLNQLTEQPNELMIMHTESDTLVISIHDANENVYFLGKAVRYEDPEFETLATDQELYEWQFLTHLLEGVNKAIVVKENIKGTDKNNKELTHRLYFYFNDDSYMLLYGTKLEL